MHQLSRECQRVHFSSISGDSRTNSPQAGESRGASMMPKLQKRVLGLAAISAVCIAAAGVHADPTVLDHWALDAQSFNSGTGTFTDSGPDAINATAATVAGGSGTVVTGASPGNPYGDSAATFAGGGGYLSLATNPFYPFIDSSYTAGSGSYPGNTVQAMNGAFSVAAWVNVPYTTTTPAGADSGNTIFADWGPDVVNGSGVSTNNHALWFAINGGHARMQLRQTTINSKGETSTDLIAFQSTNAITAGTWYQVTFVYDPTAANPGTIYVTPEGGSSASYTGGFRNGGTATTDIAYFNAPSTQIGLKGDDSGNSSHGYGTFTGQMQNLWLFNGALSANQVANLVATNNIVPEPAPLLLFAASMLGSLLLIKRRLRT